MNTQNRHAQSTEYVSPTCPPGWAWLLAGILIGVFISFLFYLREIAPQSLPPESALSPPTESVPAASSRPESVDFTLFSDLENPKDNDNEDTVVESNSDLPITIQGRYLLQVGSFRNEPEAEGLKNYLNSLGVPAVIKKTALTEKGRWYRVQIGPFTDLDELNQTRSLLAANNIPALLRKF